MRRCIYCGIAEDLSDSDIIPDALTASRIINKCVCHVEHNSGMTEKFESEVVENYNLFVLEIFNILDKGVEGIHGGNQDVVEFVIEQLQDLLSTDVIHKRGLKRFVEDNIENAEIRINKENIDESSIFYYYILYKLGQSDIQNLNDEVVKQFIIALFNTRNIDSRKVNLREKLEEMLDEEDYSKLIKLGADKIRKG